MVWLFLVSLQIPWPCKQFSVSQFISAKAPIMNWPQGADLRDRTKMFTKSSQCPKQIATVWPLLLLPSAARRNHWAARVALVCRPWPTSNRRKSGILRTKLLSLCGFSAGFVFSPWLLTIINHTWAETKANTKVPWPMRNYSSKCNQGNMFIRRSGNPWRNTETQQGTLIQECLWLLASPGIAWPFAAMVPSTNSPSCTEPQWQGSLQTIELGKKNWEGIPLNSFSTKHTHTYIYII